MIFFFFQAEDGIRDVAVTGVQTCALPISVSDCRTIRQRLAPSAARTAISRSRLEARERSRFDTFAQVIRSTKPTAPSKTARVGRIALERSEEHTSELQSRLHLVCRLLLEKKKRRLYGRDCRLFLSGLKPYGFPRPSRAR